MTQRPARPQPEQIEPSDGEKDAEARPPAVPKKARRGFSGMDPQKQRAIASRGGTVAHAVGQAHRFTTEEARAAGLKGGLAVSEDRGHMADLGRRSGEARRERLRAADVETAAGAATAPTPTATKAQP